MPRHCTGVITGVATAHGWPGWPELQLVSDGSLQRRRTPTALQEDQGYLISKVVTGSECKLRCFGIVWRTLQLRYQGCVAARYRYLVAAAHSTAFLAEAGARLDRPLDLAEQRSSGGR